MAGKQRELPSWMARKDEDRVKEKETLKRVTSAKRTRRKRFERVAFYCMNEKELVEAAVSYLNDFGGGEDGVSHDDKQVKSSVVGCSVNAKNNCVKEKRRRLSELDVVEKSSDSDAQERTYVSETDLDVAEEETLLYAQNNNTHNNNTEQGPEGQSSGPGRGHGHDDADGPGDLAQDVEGAEDHSRSQSPTADDDALRLVREIFFT
ncbi:unnamed protein product [Coregonus sp. 'balchen']|uniref:Uncharacterized protein n=1 Tax=Coregonus suidteri TaxID=861788 RepID=A0AAN8LKG0_9TELE|nr:uncharacterized protein LOC121584202 [Coregonus clupeaformis]CAB1319930.1 unnamed protein product [Coregonus sp. 'balchen']